MSPPERLCHHSWCPRVSKFHQPQQPQLQVHSSCCWAVGFCICLLCKSCLGWVDIWASLTGWQCVAKCKIARLLSLTSRLGLFFRRRILSPTAKQPHLHSEMVLKHVCSRRIYVAPQESKLALRTQIWNCTGVRNFNPWQEGCCKIWSKKQSTSRSTAEAQQVQEEHGRTPAGPGSQKAAQAFGSRCGSRGHGSATASQVDGGAVKSGNHLLKASISHANHGLFTRPACFAASCKWS